MAKPVLVVKSQRSKTAAADQPAGAVAAQIVRPRPTPAPVAPELSDSERYAQISLCAYFRAERRGFEPGYMWDDWLAAEQEVGARSAREKKP